MTAYLAYGCVLDSDLALQELATGSATDETSGQAEHIRIRVDASSVGPVAWVRRFRTPDRRVWLTVGRSEAGLVLRFPYVADFVVNDDGTVVTVNAAPDSAGSTVRHLLLDQVLPRCRALRGETVLHASAVRVDDRVVAFVGPTGAGKSTLAVALSQAGATLLTDDCVVVRSGARLHAFGSYPGARLWPDSIDALDVVGPQTEFIRDSDKRRVVIGSTTSWGGTGGVLETICVLPTQPTTPPPEVPRLKPLSGRAAFFALHNHAFRFDTGSRERLAADADRISVVASRVRMLRLDVPRDLSVLRSSSKTLLADLLPDESARSDAGRTSSVPVT